NLEEVAVSAEQRMAETRKRIRDLQEHNNQAFEYEDRLAKLSRRQNEIGGALDLTKGQAAAQLCDSPTEGNESSGITSVGLEKSCYRGTAARRRFISSC